MTNSKKKFLSIFAILFALLFAVGLVFGAACKKNKEEEEEEPTHTHSYTAGTWEWNDDYTACTTTATCTSTTGECDAPTVTWEATVTFVATAETCVDAGYTTYTATYNGSTVATEKVAGKDATGEHTYTDEKKVEFTWTEDETEGYKVSATISCAVCGSTPVAMEVKVEGPANNEFYGTYTATATYGDVSVTDTKELADPSSRESGNLFISVDDLTTGTYTSNYVLGENALAKVILTAGADTDQSVDIEAQTSSKTDDDAKIAFHNRLKTGGEGTTEYRSIEFVLTGGADITVWMCSSNGSDGRTVNFFDATGKETGLIYQKEIAGSNTDKLVRWTVSVGTAGTYYLASDASGLNIYGIAVSEYTGNYTSDVPSTGEPEPTPENPVYSVVVEGATDNTLALTITDGEEGADDVYGSATVSLQKDGETVESAEAKFEVTSGSDYVTAENGVITAKAAGTATVIVTYYDTDNTTVLASVTITVTVTDNRTPAGGTEEPEPEPEPETEQIVTLPTEEDVEASLTIGSAVFANQDDVAITDDGDGNYTVTGTASIMGEAEMAAWGTDNADAYVVIKIYVPDGYSVTFNNTNKTYQNWDGGEGQSEFDGDYMFVIYRLLPDGTHSATYTIKAQDETGEGTTYTVDYSGVTNPTIINLPTETDVAASLTIGSAVFANQSDVEIATGEGNTFTVTGTASIMGQAEMTTWGTDTADAYVVIKIYVPDGYSVTFNNTNKTYQNWDGGEGQSEFDGDYMFVIYRLLPDGTHSATYTIKAQDETGEGTTYTVDFSGVTIPEEPEQTIIDLPTAEDVQNSLTMGSAVFANQNDVTITDSGDNTYTVTGTASVMGENEMTAWGTDTADAYVVIKIYVPEGYSVTFNNTSKTYQNWEGGEGQSTFDGDYMFVVYRLLAENDNESKATYTIKAKDETGDGTTYTVDFSGVEIPSSSTDEDDGGGR